MRRGTDRPGRSCSRAGRTEEGAALGRRETRRYLLGALLAALTAGAVFLAGLGLTVALLVLFWG